MSTAELVEPALKSGGLGEGRAEENQAPAPEPMVIIAQFDPRARDALIAHVDGLPHVEVVNFATDAVVMTIHGERWRRQQATFEVAGWPEVSALTVIHSPDVPRVLERS